MSISQIKITDGGSLKLFDDDNSASGSITVPSALTSDRTYTLPDATGTVALTSDIPAVISLEASYQEGNTIGGGNGDLEISNINILLSEGALIVDDETPSIVYQTQDAGAFNFHTRAVTDLFLISRGDQDADAYGDTLEDILVVDGANRRLGLNTVTPDSLAHLLSSSGNALLNLEAPTGSDSAIIFTEDSTSRFQLGYDQSAGGLVTGLGTLATPAVFIENTTGDIGINNVAPGAKVHITSAEELISVFESTEADGPGGIALLDTNTSDNTQVRVNALADDMQLVSNGAVALTVGASGALTADNWDIQSDGDINIGAITATALVHTFDSTGGIAANFTTAADDDNIIIRFGDQSAANSGFFVYDHDDDTLTLGANGATQATLSSTGLSIGDLVGADGTNTLVLTNGTAPTGTATNSVVLYAEDVSTSSELKVRDEAGNVTTLSPHSEVHGHKLSEEMGWSFYSEREGKYVWVDMLKTIRAIENLSGEQLVHIGAV